MGPKCVQLCKENPYFEVFITNFHAVAGHVLLRLSEALVGGEILSSGKGLGTRRVAERAGHADTNHHLGRAKWVVLDNVHMQSLVRIDL